MPRVPRDGGFHNNPCPYDIRQWLLRMGWDEDPDTLGWRPACHCPILGDEYDRVFAWYEVVSVEFYRFISLGGR